MNMVLLWPLPACVTLSIRRDKVKILVIGSGGREHALAWALKKDDRVQEVFVAPGNAGMEDVARCVDIAIDDLEGLRDFAQKEGLALTIVGPELPLTLGIVDIFEEAGLTCFGPTMAAARLEGSKAFSKRLMEKYKIPTARFATFDAVDPAIAFVDEIGLPCVVKADGLAAGKGVLICETKDEAEEAIRVMLEESAFGTAGKTILIEEFLNGEEVSVLSFSDGEHVCVMESARDHKRIFDGDQGPNTGGMGAYSPAEADVYDEALVEEVKKSIVEPTIAAMRLEGCPFKGVLYTGLMLTKDGPKVLEYNARFGDPETQPLMARLDSSLLEAIEKTIAGELKNYAIKWKENPALTVILAAKGYPESPEKGKVIRGLEQALPEGVTLFHSGTKKQGENILTNGGRVLGVTATGNNVAEARKRAYEACDLISFDGMQYRKDIGAKALKERDA